MNKLKVATRLGILIGLLCLLMVGIGLSGLWGMKSANDGLKTVYEDRTVPLGQLGDIQHHQLLSQIAIGRAVQDPHAETVAGAIREIEANSGVIDTLWKEYMATYLTAEETVLARSFAEARAQFVEQALRPAMAALRTQNVAEARRLEESAISPMYAGVDKALEALMKLQIDVARQEYDAAVARYATLRLVTGAVLAVGLLFGLWFGVTLTRGLGRELGTEPGTAAALAHSVAKGDLSVDMALREGDASSLMAALKTMRDGLAQVVTEVRGNADSVACASTQIAQGNSALSQRTEEQASALEETAASMEQLAATVKQNADNAQQANQLAQGASAVAVRGGEVVAQVVGTMKDIHDSSRRIGDIIGVIDGIAFQTNILALNAAVEAARAGDQGRGFAVVASEVRVLAQRSAEAAREIKSLIHASVERVEQGATLVDQAGTTMTDIVRSIQRVTDIMGEISAASVEQSAGMAQIGEAVSQLDQTTQQNAALVEESAAAAESLQAQAQQLVRSVAVFRTGGKPLSAGLAGAGAESSLGRHRVGANPRWVRA